MRPTGYFLDVQVRIEAVIARKGIGLDVASVVREEPERGFLAATSGKLVRHQRVMASMVSGIDPESTLDGGPSSRIIILQG
jgi:hypothetical protein